MNKIVATLFFVCQINQGDVGLLKYKAKTYEDAVQAVVEECVEKRKEMYFKRYGESPDEDREILFIETCVNEVKCQ